MAGKRAAARRRVDAEIMRAARAQLAEVGASGISLREIARDVGLVSSAVYRYVDSRDALLTRLIVEAYDALGGTVERSSADHADRSDLERWQSTCASIRSWAVAHPHDYLLLYGSPVPGYAAPTDTVTPGTRATRALASIVGDASAAGRLADCAVGPGIDHDLVGELDRLAEAAAVDLDAPHVAAFVLAWTQLFGLIGFELTNQTRGMIDSHAEFFDLAVRTTGYSIGLR